MKKNKSQCIMCGSNKLNKYRATITGFLVDRMFSNKKEETFYLKCNKCKI